MADKKKRFDKDSINLMVAVCAVLISAASFYATYVQSTAAERQVKAETWPYLQILSGNYDIDAEESVLYLRLENAGVGPAHVKTFQLFYQAEPVQNIYELIGRCCVEGGEVFRDDNGELLPKFRNIISGIPAPNFVPAGDRELVYSIVRNEDNFALWQQLDVARLGLTATACYCSLLEECFETDFEGEPTEVKFCKLPSKQD